jgi:hypothetical protein
MDNEKRMKVLSLGWGVQSFTLAAMAAVGEFEMPDEIIHADTMHESSMTYNFINQWTDWLYFHGLRVHTVKDNKAPQKVFNGEMIPAYTNNNGKMGQAFRTCTGRWKIQPMRRWIQAHRHGEPVEMWLGISTDEAMRMRDSDVKYITNRYPLIEMNLSRNDCKDWLISHGFPVPPKSACVFCPFHDTKEWRHIKAITMDWDNAVHVDRAIRKARPPYDLFVHPSRKPLEEVDFRTMEEMGQMRLWDEECTGMCGV